MNARTNAPLALAACTLLAVCVTGLAGAVQWIGQPFPGFLLLANRVVASATVPGWPATAGGEIYQHELVGVEGVVLEDPEQLRAQLATLSVDVPVSYRFRRGDREFERAIRTRRFGLADFGLLYGVYLLNGLVLGGAALTILARGRRSRIANATLPFLLLAALWGLSAMDLYGPYRLFRLHALCEPLLFAAALHMAAGLAKPAGWTRSLRRLVAGAYAGAVLLAIVYQLGLFTPAIYVRTHLLATSAGGASLLVLMGSLVWRYLRPTSSQTRRRVAVLAAAAAVSLFVPIGLLIGEVLTGGRAPQNAVGFTAFLFPLAIGYEVLRRDLLGASGPGSNTAR